jgi:hypothetical protein
MSGANSSSGIIGLGKMRSRTTVLSPLLVMSWGFFYLYAPRQCDSGVPPQESKRNHRPNTGN